MSGRARRVLPPAIPKRQRAAGPAWAVRLIVVAAVLLVVAALVVTIATGTLFTTPGGR